MKRTDWPLILTVLGIACVVLVEVLASNFVPSGSDRRLEIYTLGLAVATVGLAGAAIAQVELSRRTAVRQLRAYISVRERETTPRNGSILCSIQFRNVGQTPAYAVRTSFAVWLDSHPDPEGSGSEPSSDPEGSSYVLGPTDFVWIERDVAVSADELVMIRLGLLALWAVGTIWYRDGFGRDRETHFKFFAVGADIETPGQRMFFTPDGNNAT